MVSFDSDISEDDKPLITLPCMRTLVKMAGVTFQKRKKISRTENKVRTCGHFFVN